MLYGMMQMERKIKLESFFKLPKKPIITKEEEIRAQIDEESKDVKTSK
jgi:hypothetical protein